MSPPVTDIVDAIHSLRPGAQWVLRGLDTAGIEWLDEQQDRPSEAEIIAEMARLSALSEAQQYQQSRASAYPSINDQLDMLWHALDQGKLDKTSDFYTTLAAVKAQYPKGDAQ